MSDKKTKNDRPGIRVRQRVVSPEVQRFEQESKLKATAATLKVEPTRTGFNLHYTRAELERMEDDQLVRVILNTPHQRIHVEALTVAKKRRSLHSNQVIQRKIQEESASQAAAQVREEEIRKKKMLENSLVSLIPGVPGDKRWYSVQIGVWSGTVFATAEDFMGQAYRRYTQEVEKIEANPNFSFRALPRHVLPN